MSTTATLFPLPTDQAAVDFFYERAGFSYNPATETLEEGHLRSARELAEAEAYAEAHQWSAYWEDDYDRMEDEWADWPQYVCQVVDADGDPLASLGGVMFSDRGTPDDGDPYARVVRAELFAEAMRKHLCQLEREASR